MHDSSACPVCRDLPRDSMVSEEVFLKYLAACREELAQKQDQLVERIKAATNWAYDLDDCSLLLGSERFRITPVGTFNPQTQTWLWAWANEALPQIAREASKQIQTLHTLTGLPVFLNRGSVGYSSDAEDYTTLAVHLVEGIGMFRLPSDGPVMYVVVHEI